MLPATNMTIKNNMPKGEVPAMLPSWLKTCAIQPVARPSASSLEYESISESQLVTPYAP